MSHPSLEQTKKVQSFPTSQDTIMNKPQKVKPKVKVIREQVDLAPILERLDNIEVELAGLNKWNEELVKKQIEVLNLFGQALKTKVDQ